VQRDLVLLAQVAAYGLGPQLPQLLVVLVGADVVRVPLDLNVDALVLALELLGELVESRLGLG
jgi:hypothetical protein